MEGRPEISAPINGSFVVGSAVDSKRRPPPPPSSEQSPKNGRPPAPLPNESGVRGRPPLPPPRTTGTPDVLSKSQSGHLEEDVRLRNGSNGDSRNSSQRRSVPAAGNGDSGTKSNRSLPMNVNSVDENDARHDVLVVEMPPGQIPLHVSSIAPSQVRVASTRLTSHSSLPRSSSQNIVLDDRECPDPNTFKHPHAPTIAFVNPPAPPHHAHLNPTLPFPAQGPIQNVVRHHDSGEKIRPPSVSSAEEELAAANQKTKKKGMMSSLFKRNK